MFGDIRVTVKTATDGTDSLAHPVGQAMSAKPAAPPQPPPVAPRPSPPPPHLAPGGVARTPATLRGAATPTLSSPAMRPPPPPPPPKKQ
jgi:hypothetical protein